MLQLKKVANPSVNLYMIMVRCYGDPASVSALNLDYTTKYKKTEFNCFSFYKSNNFEIINNITELVISNYKKVHYINNEDIELEKYNKIIERNPYIIFFEAQGKIMKRAANSYEFMLSAYVDILTKEKLEILINSSFLNEIYDKISHHDPLIKSYFYKKIYFKEINLNQKEDIIQELNNLMSNHKSKIVKDIIETFLTDKKYNDVKGKILNSHLLNLKNIAMQYNKLNNIM